MNIPNLLSLLRIILIPLFLYLVSLRTKESMMWALAVFALASITDMLDGWSARVLNQITDLGKFLDPLADKLLVISTFIAFLFLDPLIPFWMIIVIISRDLLITLMRYLAIRKGTMLRTSRFGKIKTFFQMVSIMIILMVFIVRHSGMDYSPYHLGNDSGFGAVYDIYMSDMENKALIITPYCLMAIVTFMTAFSGFRYLFTNWKLFLPPYSDSRKA